MVPVASDRVPRAPSYSGSRSPHSGFRLRELHPLRCAFQCTSTILRSLLIAVLQPQSSDWFRLLRFRSPLLSESLLFFSPPGTKMFQFPGFSSLALCIPPGCLNITSGGFPHSDTPGSLPVYDSPRRFAVHCVLLLLYMPRHPPYALTYLIFLENCFQVFPPFFNRLAFSNLVFFNYTERLLLSFYLFVSSVIQFSKNN